MSDVVPSTLGGPGWRPRLRAHRDELGDRWRRVGVRSEVAVLRDVLLTVPGEGMGAVTDPSAELMLGPVDLSALRDEREALAEAYCSFGVRVHDLVAPDDATPNLLFLRDVVLGTPAGAIVARMAAEQRAGEERVVARRLAELGVPIVGTVTDGCLEGADVLWVGSHEVLVGVGRRTDRRGTAQIRGLLGLQGITATAVLLVGPVQHLLGALTFAAPDLATVHPRSASPELCEALASRGIRALVLDDDDELRVRRGNNFVAIAPGHVLLPAGCPGIRRRLAAAGVDSTEVRVDQSLAAGGGIGCLTAILHRSSEGEPS